MNVFHLLKVGEPLGLTRLSTIISAIFPTAGGPQYQKYLICLNTLFHINYLLFLVSCGLHLASVTDFFANGLQSLNFFFGSLCFYFKYVNLNWYGRQYLAVVDDIQRFSAELNERAHMVAATRTANRLTLFFYYVFCFQAIAMNTAISFKLNYNSDKVILPLQLWVPQWFRENALRGTFIQNFMLFFVLYIVGTMTPFLYSVSAHLAALGTSLAQDLKNGKWTRKGRKSLIVRHQKLLRIVQTIIELQDKVWIIEMCVAAVQITSSGYDLFKAVKKSDLTSLIQLVVFFNNLIVTYVLFASGTLISAMGEELHGAFYEVNWPFMERDERKDLAIILMRTGGPVEYHYKRAIAFNRPSFTAVLNATASYFAFLQFLDSQSNY